MYIYGRANGIFIYIYIYKRTDGRYIFIYINIIHPKKMQFAANGQFVLVFLSVSLSIVTHRKGKGWKYDNIYILQYRKTMNISTIESYRVYRGAKIVILYSCIICLDNKVIIC